MPPRRATEPTIAELAEQVGNTCDNNCSYRARRAKANADDAEDSPVRGEPLRSMSSIASAPFVAATPRAVGRAGDAGRSAHARRGGDQVVDFRELARNQDGPTVAARPVGCGSCRACIGKTGPCTLGTRPELALVPRAPDLSHARHLGGRDLPSSVIDCKPELPPAPLRTMSYQEAIGFHPCRLDGCKVEEAHEYHGEVPYGRADALERLRGGGSSETGGSDAARAPGHRPTISAAPGRSLSDTCEHRTGSGGSVTRACERCRADFEARTYNHRYCDACRIEIDRAAWRDKDAARRAAQRAERRPWTITCAKCSTVFEQARTGGKKRLYCFACAPVNPKRAA